MSTLSVSVVVCTHNRPECVEECLRAIAALSPAPSEVIIVDSVPLDESSHHIAERWGARYLRVDLPGASHARNAGMRAAQGEFVAFVDDDGRPEHGWLAGLAREFTDPQVACVAGRVMPLPGTPEENAMYELV